MKSKPMMYLTLFFGVFCLSSSAIFVKLSSAPSSITAFYRLLFTAIMLLPALVFSRQNREALLGITRKQAMQILAAGFLLAVHYVLWFESLRYTSVASSTVLVTLQPLFSIVWGYLFFKERYSKTALMGCAIAIGGAMIIGWGDFRISGLALLGDIMAFAAAGVISGYFLIGQKVRSELPVVPYSIAGFLSSAFFLALYSMATGASFTGYDQNTWLAFLGIAFLATICGQFLFNVLLKWLPATFITMSILGESVGTCILAYFILHEALSLRQLVGIVVILGGLLIFFMNQNKKE
ncbi:MAG: DMT family transporter [Clostridia bacterium]|nr:DMT family transporter [Clostridia bacterium]MBQ3091466.1 DMT family transporter [Clostridia bacterium]MBQ9925415.1 DMT family transporter [Clostridia bacterium]